jgi:protein-S-isoprenylcysteine O-methyltransferase Ste14
VWVGAALSFHSWIAFIAVASLMSIAYGWRIRAEERMLAAAFGEEFHSYVDRTARLIPNVF